MKKVLLTAMALLTIASTSVFGMYGSDSSWIDFLVHGNQLRARMNQFGFVLGNDTIRGTFGFKSEGTTLGAIMNTSTVTPDGKDTKQFYNFIPTLSAGIGYTSDAFSIGVGYNYTYRHDTLREFIYTTTTKVTNSFTKNGYGLSVHTPVLAINAMNDSIRIVIPVQIAVKNGNVDSLTKEIKYMGISMDPQIRYYTGLETLTQLRLYVKYGMNEIKAPNQKYTGSSLGFDFRAYFGATVGDIALSPFIRVTYDTALGAKGKSAYSLAKFDTSDFDTLSLNGDKTYGLTSGSATVFSSDLSTTTAVFDSNPWQLKVLPVLGLTANSDIVSIYVEAGAGYTAINTGKKLNAGQNGITHALAWSSYGEIYINPIKDLQWYFEAEIGNQSLDTTTPAISGDLNVQFNASTGITWYLPAL